MKWGNERPKRSLDHESDKLHGELIAYQLRDAKVYNRHVVETLVNGAGLDSENPERGKQFATFILDPAGADKHAEHDGRLIYGEPTVQAVQLKQDLYNQTHAMYVDTLTMQNGSIQIYAGSFDGRQIFLTDEISIANGQTVHSMRGSNYDPTEELLTITKDTK